MSAPITSVTEGRVTVTANDTEDNIREAAGFPDAPEPETPDTPDKPEKLEPEPGERNPDGTFKAKAAPEPAKPEGDPRKSHQAKINIAIAKQREAERRADEAERRATEREAELQALKQPPPTPAARVEPPAPSATRAKPTEAEIGEKYQTYGDFVEDLADWKVEQREAQRDQIAAQRERESHVTTAVNLATERHPDFAALMASDTRVYPDAVMEHLRVEASLDPSLSAELLHHLLTHPDDAERLAKMHHPIAAAREIGRLTAGLSSAPSGPETVLTHTTAKPLIKPVRSSVMAPESSPPEDLPFGPKYIAAMNERDRKAREARRA